MSSEHNSRQSGRSRLGSRSTTPSLCAVQGTVSRAGSRSSSGSSSVGSLLSDWHKVTDCSVRRWSTGASAYEKKCVAKMLGTVTAGKHFFQSQLQAALEKPPPPPPEDPNARPGQIVQLVYENPEAAGVTINQRWLPDFIIHPNLMSERIEVRPKLLNWPVPPSRALH